MAGEFEQLLPFTWRGKHYPLTRIHLSLAHDLVEHKYWGVDGARVEATGVAPVMIEAEIPISNHIVPGAKEKWQATNLYPEALRQFIVDFAKKTTGYIQHPEFGELAVKPKSLDFELSGDKRGATSIRASWVETHDDDLHNSTQTSPVTDIEIACTDLSASMVDLRKLAPQLPKFKDDIASLGRKITALVDTVSILSYRSAGAINRILYQAHRISVSLDRAANALTWPAKQNVQRIKSAAYDIRRKLLTPGGIGFKIVPADTTLAGTLRLLPPGNTMGVILQLNPELVRSPVVPEGALVRYPLVPPPPDRLVA